VPVEVIKEVSVEFYPGRFTVPEVLKLCPILDFHVASKSKKPRFGGKLSMGGYPDSSDGIPAPENQLTKTFPETGSCGIQLFPGATRKLGQIVP
jgi:hypothetical protein